MDKQDILNKVDHTMLNIDATWKQIKAICDEAINASTATVCIPPCYVEQASKYLKDRIPVCTVIGFPNGNMTIESKCFETQDAITNGASEIDMVINIGKLKDKDYDYIKNEIASIARTCKMQTSISKTIILKVIIETCLLTDEEIEKMCFICAEAGADYIKTSTGFSSDGANSEVLRIMADTIKNNNLTLKIKAAGGIKDVKTAEDFISIGADRLGTSKLIKLLTTENQPLEEELNMSKLSERRKMKGLTQQQLAEKSHVTVRSIRAYEQGSKKINKAQANTLYSLSKTLKCKMEDLLEEE